MKSFYLIAFLTITSITLNAQWEEITPPPSDFRTHHTFGFSIYDRGYLLTGSTASELTDDFYSYDYLTDKWTKLPDFPGGTRGFGIGEVWNNKAYFGFGLGMHPDSTSDNFANDLWEYDPITEEWTALASCPCNARLHPAFVTHDGNIYVGLGNRSGIGNMKDWWQYNIETDTWTQKADFPSHERHHPFQFTVGDYIYVGFGHGTVAPSIYREWYRYDPTTDEWTEVAQIPGEGRVAGTQFAHKDYGYVLSGDGQDHQSMDIGEFWKYDALADEWIEMPPHPGTSRWAPASFVINNEVYLINGTSYGQFQNKAYKYSLEELTTTESTSWDNNNVSIYPNPFDQEVTIEINEQVFSTNDDMVLRIFDSLGKRIRQERISKNNTSINLPDLKSGMYFIEILRNEAILYSKPFVKR